jgi:hypothetical protein
MTNGTLALLQKITKGSDLERMSNAFKEVLVLAINPFVLLAAIATNCIQKLLKKPSSKLEIMIALW